MGDPVTGADRNVFGANSAYHDITGMPLENGRGALPIDQQALLHCNVIEQREGKAAADAMRAKLKAAPSKGSAGNNQTTQSIAGIEKSEGKPAAAAAKAAVVKE